MEIEFDLIWFDLNQYQYQYQYQYQDDIRMVVKMIRIDFKMVVKMIAG